MNPEEKKQCGYIIAHGVYRDQNLVFDGDSCAIYTGIRLAKAQKVFYETLFPNVKYSIKTIKIEVVE